MMMILLFLKRLIRRDKGYPFNIFKTEKGASVSRKVDLLDCSLYFLLLCEKEGQVNCKQATLAILLYFMYSRKIVGGLLICLNQRLFLFFLVLVGWI